MKGNAQYMPAILRAQASYIKRNRVLEGQQLKPSRKKSHELPIEAANWAASFFDFEATKMVTNHSWAKTYQLKAGNGEKSYLKILPRQSSAPNQALVHIANQLQPHVPKLIAAEPEKGFYLYQNHMGHELDRFADQDEKSEILTNYARIQSNALSMPEMFHDLPKVLPSAQYDLFIELMDKALDSISDTAFGGNPFYICAKAQ